MKKSFDKKLTLELKMVKKEQKISVPDSSYKYKYGGHFVCEPPVVGGQVTDLKGVDVKQTGFLI